MTWLQWLQAAASVASVVTAGIAAWAYGRYVWNRRQKRLRLENYLKDVKERGIGDGGMRRAESCGTRIESLMPN